MIERPTGKYYRALLLFVTVLLLFLVVTDILLVNRLRSQLFDEEYQDAQDEIKMMEVFLRESLLGHNYDEIELMLLQWKEEDNDLLAVEAVLPNGYALVQSTGLETGPNSYVLEKQIRYLGKDLMHIKVVKNFSHIVILEKLQRQLIIGSIILTAVFGVFLWLTIRIFALSPLERVKENLETIVQERTGKWVEANTKLTIEIKNRKKAQKELKHKIGELEEFYEMAVGREVKMKELKEEIAKLKS